MYIRYYCYIYIHIYIYIYRYYCFGNFDDSKYQAAISFKLKWHGTWDLTKQLVIVHEKRIEFLLILFTLFLNLVNIPFLHLVISGNEIHGVTENINILYNPSFNFWNTPVYLENFSLGLPITIISLWELSNSIISLWELPDTIISLWELLNTITSL